MKELVIKVKGTVPSAIKWDDKKKAENYPEGEGLYAIDTDGQITGIVWAYDFRTNDEGENICTFNEFFFYCDIVSDIAVRNREFELKEYIAEASERVLKEIRELCYNTENAFAEVNEGVKKISENGGNAKGITEKTLLSALSIVTRGGTNNGDTK